MTSEPAAAPKRAFSDGFNYAYYAGDSAQLQKLDTFYFSNQKGAKLYVGDQLLIQYTEQTGTPYISYRVPLGKGFYPIRVEYVNTGEQPLQMPYLPFYITPQSSSSNDPKAIPSSVEYYK